MKTTFALTVYFAILKDKCRNLHFKTPTNINMSAIKLPCMTENVRIRTEV